MRLRLLAGIRSTIGAKDINESHECESLTDATVSNVWESASATIVRTDFGMIRNTRTRSNVSIMEFSGFESGSTEGVGSVKGLDCVPCLTRMCRFRPLRVNSREHSGQGTLEGASG